MGNTADGARVDQAGAQSKTVLVNMTISALNQAILLSQSGLSFLAVQNGGVVPNQSFGVQNIGVGVVNWTVSTSTLAGSGWLRVTPAAGGSDAAASTSSNDRRLKGSGNMGYKVLATAQQLLDI